MATTERVVDTNVDSAIVDDDASPTDGANKSGFGSSWNPDSTADPATIEEPSSPKRDRRMSREWDASKVPPSQFQKRKGSIYSTPSSRDGHIERNNVVWNTKYDKKEKKKTKDGKEWIDLVND